MPFNFLLWDCLIPGDTSVNDPGTGKSAHIQRRSSECVLAFKIDNQDFRKRFNVTKACDGLFFYKSEVRGPVLLFVELKGADIANAARQIGQALQAVRTALRPTAEYRAVVVTGRTAPAKRDTLWRQFSREYGVELEVCRGGDLRRLLERRT